MPTHDRVQVPPACSLPTAEQPVRLAEFDALFAASLRSQESTAATRLRWTLDPDVEAHVRDLAAREAACCSFLTVTVTGAAEGLHVDIEVPPQHGDVLSALRRRAEIGMRSQDAGHRTVGQRRG